MISSFSDLLRYILIVLELDIDVRLIICDKSLLYPDGGLFIAIGSN